MKKIFSEETIRIIKDRETVEVVSSMLNSSYHLSRSHAAILVGIRIDENYLNYMQLLLNEMNKEVHFSNIRFGIKSAWTVAISLIEHLKPEDYPKIKQEFDKWDNEEKENLLNWLKQYPEHCKILEDGHL